MPSLSSYDRGRLEFEGRRYKKDIQAAHDAQRRLFKPIDAYNKKRASLRKRKFSLFTVHCLGNHDQGRINTAISIHPELEGMIGVKDLNYEKYWNVIVPFKEVGMLNGVLFSHYFSSGVKGQPISGENIGNSLIRKNLGSSIQGHTHTYDLKQMVCADGTVTFGLSCGCFTHPEMLYDWNANTAHMWRNCITILHNVWEGGFDKFELLEHDYVMRRYT